MTENDKRLLERAKNVLRKHMVAFVYSNGYPTMAVPQATVESLTELVALDAKNNVSEDRGEGSALPHISCSVPVKGDYIETKCGCGCGTVILVGK